MEHAQEKDYQTILEQFEMVWNNVESGIMIIDAETREVLDANPAAARIYGGTKEEIIGEICYTFFGRHECPVLDLHQDIDRTEFQFIRADGTTIPILKTVSKTQYNGRPALLESFTDISYIKENEEKNRILETNEFVRIMFDTTPLCAHLWNKNFEMIDCNREAVNMFKMSGKKEYLQKLHMLTPEFQPDGSNSKEKQRACLKKAFEEGYQCFEWMRQTVDGEPFPTEVTLVRVDYKGESHVAAYSRDLREQKRMMQE
ncbi:MAG: PAS domain S-box protein, partial [Oscillospiraceae bacterium]|nr:PAS domain S-box protein [Oscillospiraceae bacterium]